MYLELLHAFQCLKILVIASDSFVRRIISGGNSPRKSHTTFYRAGSRGVFTNAVYSVERCLLHRADGPHDGLLVACTLPDEIRVDWAAPKLNARGTNLHVCVVQTQTGQWRKRCLESRNIDGRPSLYKLCKRVLITSSC